MNDPIKPKTNDDDTDSNLEGDESRDAAGSPSEPNEGEGSRTAARRYDEGAERAASDPKRVEELANKAREALDGPEGQALRKADQEGKLGQTAKGGDVKHRG
jgi:hypothetical protein